MATQNVNTIGRGSLNLDTVAVAADAGLSDKWSNTGSEFLYVNNASGAPITATLNFPVLIDGQTVAGRTVSIPAGKHVLIGPFPTNYYNDNLGYASVNWSAVASVTLAVCRLGS